MTFWKEKSVLVTGASGFIGSNLVKALTRRGAKVIALAKNGIPSDCLIRLENIDKDIYRIEEGSVENFSWMNNIVKKYKVKIIYHLAAQPLVEEGSKSPLKTFNVNIKGTWNVLEVARRNNIKKVIVASTTHVYGNNPNLPYKEEYFPQPSRLYETSKACADLLAQSYADTYELGVEIPRFTNIYGPGDRNFSRLIPKMMRSIVESTKVTIWDIGIRRDFLYVDDAIAAYLKLVETELPKSRRIRVFNFGYGKPIHIFSIVKKIIALSGEKNVALNVIPIPKNREHEVVAQYVSTSKAKKYIHWTPKVNLDEGLLKTLVWYKNYFRS